jgi:ATP-dependent Lon protease
MIDEQPSEAPRVITYSNSLKERLEKIAFFISHEMAFPFITKEQTRNFIQKLIKLGLSEKAREVFLESRAKIIQERLG